jgi:hypothetical protein
MSSKHTSQRPKDNKVYIIWHKNNNTHCSTVIGVYEDLEEANRVLEKVKSKNTHLHCEITLTEESVYEY